MQALSGVPLLGKVRDPREFIFILNTIPKLFVEKRSQHGLHGHIQERCRSQATGCDTSLRLMTRLRPDHLKNRLCKLRRKTILS
jgi:hypothetical protein